MGQIHGFLLSVAAPRPLPGAATRLPCYDGRRAAPRPLVRGVRLRVEVGAGV